MASSERRESAREGAAVALAQQVHLRLLQLMPHMFIPIPHRSTALWVHTERHATKCGSCARERSRRACGVGVGRRRRK